MAQQSSGGAVPAHVGTSIEETQSASAIAFRERQWVPLWVVAAFAAGFFGFVMAIFVLVDVFDPSYVALSVSGQLAIAVGAGVFVVLVLLYSTLLRVITVGGGMLKVAHHGTVDLTPSVNVAIARGAEVRKLRNDMSVALSAGGALTPVGQVGSAVGGLSVGVSALRMARLGRGMVAGFWMHEAVVVHAPDNLGVKLWLIGTKHPDELAAAIQAQIAAASSS